MTAMSRITDQTTTGKQHKGHEISFGNLGEAFERISVVFLHEQFFPLLVAGETEVLMACGNDTLLLLCQLGTVVTAEIVAGYDYYETCTRSECEGIPVDIVTDIYDCLWWQQDCEFHPGKFVGASQLDTDVLGCRAAYNYMVARNFQCVSSESLNFFSPVRCVKTKRKIIHAYFNYLSDGSGVIAKNKTQENPLQVLATPRLHLLTQKREKSVCDRSKPSLTFLSPKSQKS